MTPHIIGGIIAILTTGCFGYFILWYLDHGFKHEYIEIERFTSKSLFEKLRENGQYLKGTCWGVNPDEKYTTIIYKCEKCGKIKTVVVNV